MAATAPRARARVLGAFTVDADYTRIVQHEPAEAFAFWDNGPELARRFRALKVWMTLAYAGSEATGAAIESNLDCVRDLPPHARTSRERSPTQGHGLDRLNERILQDVRSAARQVAAGTAEERGGNAAGSRSS